MKTMLLSMLLGAALLLFGCATAESTAVRGETQPEYVNVRYVDRVAVNRADADADPKEILCKRARLTGSRFHRIYCATRFQWDEERRRAELFFDKVR